MRALARARTRNGFVRTRWSFFSFLSFSSTTNRTKPPNEKQHTVNPLKHTRKHHTCISTYLSSRKNRIVIRVCYFFLSLSFSYSAWTFCVCVIFSWLAWLDGTDASPCCCRCRCHSLNFDMRLYLCMMYLYMYVGNKQKLKLWKFLDEKHHTSAMLTTIVVMMTTSTTTTMDGGDGTVFYVKSTRVTSQHRVLHLWLLWPMINIENS